MKPRFKLRLDGTVSLVQLGESGLSEYETRQLIKKTSGSLLRHCKRFGIEYDSAVRGLNTYSIRTAGKAATVRGLLGLPVCSSKLAQALAAANARRRGNEVGYHPELRISRGVAA